MKIDDVVDRLIGVRRTARGCMARCPAHDDHSPSLSLREGSHGLLMKCWAGCSLKDITAALGFRIADLFFDTRTTLEQRHFRKSPELDRLALAFRYELAALDRRTRACTVFSKLTGLDMANVSEPDLDRLLSVAAMAYSDLDRADVFEQVADTLRLGRRQERTVRHAA